MIDIVHHAVWHSGQVATGDESANPADSALYNGISKALVREGEAPLALPALPGECQVASMRMLHFLMGTQLRRHIERWDLTVDTAPKAVISARGSIVSLCTRCTVCRCN